jgi:hypothetical protein
MRRTACRFVDVPAGLSRRARRRAHVAAACLVQDGAGRDAAATAI